MLSTHPRFRTLSLLKKYAAVERKQIIAPFHKITPNQLYEVWSSRIFLSALLKAVPTTMNIMNATEVLAYALSVSHKITFIVSNLEVI
jgi:hypothetical protein